MSMNKTFLIVLFDLEKDLSKLSWKDQLQCSVYIMVLGCDEQD